MFLLEKYSTGFDDGLTILTILSCIVELFFLYSAARSDKTLVPKQALLFIIHLDRSSFCLLGNSQLFKHFVHFGLYHFQMALQAHLKSNGAQEIVEYDYYSAGTFTALIHLCCVISFFVLIESVIYLVKGLKNVVINLSNHCRTKTYKKRTHF